MQLSAPEKHRPCLRTHRLPAAPDDPDQANTITSSALSLTHAVSLANARIHVFPTRAGTVFRTLTSHAGGI